MAAKNVITQVLGGDKKVLDEADSVGSARDMISLSSDYTATVNGQPASDSDVLRDGDFVAFSRKVKGGQ